MERVTIGLGIAKDEHDLSEMKKFAQTPNVDLLIMPEYYLDSRMLPEARRIAMDNKKIIVSGMEDRREGGKFFQAAIVIDANGEIIGERRKTSITCFEQKRGDSRGDSIEVFETRFGRIGVAICYELHLPEIARVMALRGAEIIINPIGTGMWHEEQFGIWNRLAATRAYENGVFVVGVSHYNDTIPIAFAYDPRGNCIGCERSINRVIPVILDPSNFSFGRNFDQRRPELYKQLSENIN